VQAASDAKAAVASQAAADQINDTSTGLDTLAAMYPGYQPYADQAAQVDAQANAATQAANAAAATALQSANAAAALSLANANAVSATAGAADEQASNANTAWNTLAADPNATPQAQQQAALGADQADTAAANDHGAAYADAADGERRSGQPGHHARSDHGRSAGLGERSVPARRRAGAGEPGGGFECGAERYSS
jgi:hypothetical protein